MDLICKTVLTTWFMCRRHISPDTFDSVFIKADYALYNVLPDELHY